MTNHWHQLLSYWIDQQHRHSLTFPFLIGALRTPVGNVITDEKIVIDEIALLINQINNYETDDHIFHIYKCPDLDKLVLTRISGKAKPPMASTVLSNQSESKNLFASDIFKSKSIIDESFLVRAIFNECGNFIINGEFSCRGKIFQPFDESELKIITKAIG